MSDAVGRNAATVSFKVTNTGAQADADVQAGATVTLKGRAFGH